MHERRKWYENSCTKLHRRLILNFIQLVGRDLYFVCISLLLIESLVSIQIVEGLMPTVVRIRTLFHNLYKYILRLRQKNIWQLWQICHKIMTIFVVIRKTGLIFMALMPLKLCHCLLVVRSNLVEIENHLDCTSAHLHQPTLPLSFGWHITIWS